MDPIIWLLLVVLVLVVIIGAFAVIRTKQRGGTVLAAPDTNRNEGAGR